MMEQLARSGFHVPPPPPPPKVPPWSDTTTTQVTPTNKKMNKPDPAPALASNDGDPTNHLTQEKSPKQGASITQGNLQFQWLSSPLAKRAVLHTTLEKMRRHVSEITVVSMLDTLDIATNSKGLTERQCKYQSVLKGLMVPSRAALDHPVAPLLLELATLGCHADIGKAWTIEMLEEARKKGAHPSAVEPVPAVQL